MPVVLKSLRSSMLLSRKYDLSARLTQISQKLMDLQSYAANIADGKISSQEVGSVGSSMFGTQLTFMQNSSQMAYNSAYQKTNAYMQMNSSIAQGTGGQYQYAADGQSQTQPYMIFNEIYKKELEEYANQISQKVNAEEKKLTQEQKQIETQLQMVEAEYNSLQESLSEDIKNSAPQYV